jgi:hypothetical protein
MVLSYPDAPDSERNSAFLVANFCVLLVAKNCVFLFASYSPGPSVVTEKNELLMVGIIPKSDHPDPAPPAAPKIPDGKITASHNNTSKRIPMHATAPPTQDHAVISRHQAIFTLPVTGEQEQRPGSIRIHTLIPATKDDDKAHFTILIKIAGRAGKDRIAMGKESSQGFKLRRSGVIQQVRKKPTKKELANELHTNKVRRLWDRCFSKEKKKSPANRGYTYQIPLTIKPYPMTLKVKQCAIIT